MSQAGLQWQDGMPKETGVYWVRLREDPDRAVVCECVPFLDEMCCALAGDEEFWFTEHILAYAGPLTPPKIGDAGV